MIRFEGKKIERKLLFIPDNKVLSFNLSDFSSKQINRWKILNCMVFLGESEIQFSGKEKSDALRISWEMYDNY